MESYGLPHGTASGDSMALRGSRIRLGGIRGLQAAQVGFDRDGILWVLTDKGVQVGRQLFYLAGRRRSSKRPEIICLRTGSQGMPMTLF